MSHVPPVIFEPTFFGLEMDATARGVLREDMPNYWAPDQHALSNLVVGRGSVVLEPTGFDQLSEDKKFIVVDLVKHVLSQLRQHYVRKVTGDEVPDHKSLGINFPAMYVADKDLADEILELARTPGSDGASVLNPPALNLARALYDASTAGQVVNGGKLERLLQHAQVYQEDLDRTKLRQPVTSTTNLDSDDMHAFLCAFQTCFTTKTA